MKMDDIGLHLSRGKSRGLRGFGRGLVKAMPWTMEALTVIGTAAMLLGRRRHHRSRPGEVPSAPVPALGRGFLRTGPARFGRRRRHRLAGVRLGFGRGRPGHRRRAGRGHAPLASTARARRRTGHASSGTGRRPC
ncbi:DUF808 family protein [Caulobacter segnis]